MNNISSSLDCEPAQGVDRGAFLAHRSPTHEVKLDKLIAGGSVTSEESQVGFLNTADRMLVEVVFDGEVQSIRTTGRAIISADGELGLIVFYEAESLGSIQVKTENGKALRFAKLGKVEIRRKA